LRVTKTSTIVKIANRFLRKYTNVCIDYQENGKPRQRLPDMQINMLIHPCLVYTEKPTQDPKSPERSYTNMIPGDSFALEGMGNAIVVIKPRHIESDCISIP